MIDLIIEALIERLFAKTLCKLGIHKHWLAGQTNLTSTNPFKRYYYICEWCGREIWVKQRND